MINYLQRRQDLSTDIIANTEQTNDNMNIPLQNSPEVFPTDFWSPTESVVTVEHWPTFERDSCTGHSRTEHRELTCLVTSSSPDITVFNEYLLRGCSAYCYDADALLWWDVSVCGGNVELLTLCSEHINNNTHATPVQQSQTKQHQILTKNNKRKQETNKQGSCPFVKIRFKDFSRTIRRIYKEN